MRAGDAEAYAELVRLHGPVAIRAATMLGAGADAQDVVQEAFVKAYRSLGGFREGAPFRPWLLRIVANETKNLQRSARRRTAREQSPVALAPSLFRGAGDEADPVAAAEARERHTALLSALRGLPEPARLVVTCRYLLDLDEAETATVLGVPRGTVKSRLNRALGRLRALPELATMREVRR